MGNLRQIDSIKDSGYAALAAAARAPVTGAAVILLDGVPLLEAAVDAGLKVRGVLWDENEAQKDYAISLNAMLAPRGADIMTASFHLLKRLDISASAPKCVFLVEKGEAVITDAGEIAVLGRVLAVVDVMDQMNAGVLLRHAEAFGYAVLACGETTPLNSRQVIRSSTGSGLRKPFYRSQSGAVDLIESLNRAGIQTITTSAHSSKPVYQLKWQVPHVIFVGNETRGLDPTVRKKSDEDVTIPMVSGGAHSINVAVASSIMMYEGMKACGV